MLTEHGFKGFKFHPTISAYDADGPLMDAFLAVARKHRVPVDGLAERRHALEQEVARLQTRDERRATLEAALAKARDEAWARAAAVRARRLRAATALKEAVQGRLGERWWDDLPKA